MKSTELETIVINPKHPAKSSVIWLHGLGASGDDFVPIVPQLGIPEQLAIRFIFPHAPVRPVSLNAGMEMRAWFDIYGLHAHAKQDVMGINQASHAITALIEQEQRQGIPSEKIVLAGFSMGGALALYSGLKQPAALAGIMALSTYLPAHQELQANLSSLNTETPIFLAHGHHDAILDIQLAQASREMLTHLGCQVEWHTYPMPHTVCAAEIQDIQRWLCSVLS